jgi:hypothetical protein
MANKSKVGCWWVKPGQVVDSDGRPTGRWRMVAENDADRSVIRLMCDCIGGHAHELEAKGCRVARANAEKLGGPMRIARSLHAD